MGTSRPTFVAGIGGSAGGLIAYRALLDALPSTTGMAFVIISHMNPDAGSYLVDLLSRRTRMPVNVAAHAMPIQADHVYVIPKNSDLFIENHAFKVVTPRGRRNNQIDLFLRSLAEAMGPNAIGVILTGYDGDGSEGCKQIKAKGGTTFAQDETAEVSAMPRSAQATGAVDFVLPVHKIAAELDRISRRHSEQRRRQ